MAINSQIKNSSDPFEKTSSQNVLATFIFRYLPFWPIFIITILICLVISYFYIKIQNPVFEANAMILLKDQKSQDAQNSVLFSALGINGSAKSVENETEVLRSRIVLTGVAKDMELYTELFRRGKFRDNLIYPAPVKFTAVDPEKITTSPQLSFSIANLSKDSSIMLAGKKYRLGTTITTPYGDFKISPAFTNPELMTLVKGNYYIRIRGLKQVVSSLYGSLTVLPGAKSSSLINLKFLDPVPWRAEDILNNLMRVYNKAGIDDKNTTNASTLDFVTDRLVLVEKDLSNVENRLQQFRAESGIVDLPEEGKLFLSSVAKKDELMSDVQIQLDVLDKIEKYVVKKEGQAGTVPSTLGITDPLLLQLLDKLYTAELDLDHQHQVSAENSPTISALTEQINQLRVSLLENIHNLKDNLLTSRKSLQEGVNRNAEILKTVPQKARELLEITREQEIKNTIYTYLLQKKEESALNEASAVADARIVNYGESNNVPVKPVVLNIYLIGLFAGFLAGVIFVVLKEQYNQEVLFRSEIERTTDAPILAELIHDASGESLVIKDGKRTIIAEQLRALRTSLSYIGVDSQHKTLLLTSSISGEGKSFIGLNLAVSLAITGKKVIILEFDLRKPKVSKMLNIVQEPGISNYLAGLSTYEDITVQLKDKDLPNLFVLPAGTIPPNPTELMLNGRLDTLMEQLNRDYDYILIDSPPIGLVTDAKILNKYIDVCLYMVRHKYTPRHYLKLIQTLYQNKELRNLYIIFNGIKARGVMGYYGSSGAYGYGQGFGQGYRYGGNGYTEDSTKAERGLFNWFSKSNKQ